MEPLSEAVIPRKRTLAEILTLFEELEASMDVLTEAEIESLKDELVAKIDNTKEWLGALQARSYQLKTWAGEFTARAKTMDNRIERLEEYVKYAMQQRGWKCLKGERWVVTLKQTEYVDVKKECTAEDVMAYGTDFIRASFAWDKAEFKKLVKKNDPLIISLQEKIEVKTRESISFSINKGVEK